MSKRVDERGETLANLKVYQKAKDLSTITLRVCKLKADDEKENQTHLPKRFSGIARILQEDAIRIGSNILIANEIYIGPNTETDARLRGLAERFRLIEEARRLTFDIEHAIRTVNESYHLKDSTFYSYIDAILQTRKLLIAWRQSDQLALRLLTQEPRR